MQNGGFLLEKLSIQYCYVIKVYNLLQVRSEKTLKLSESHFNVVFAVRNLPKIEYIPKQTLSKLDTDYSLENGGFCKWRGFGQTKNPPFSRFYCTNIKFDACVPGGVLLVHHDNANFRPQNKAKHV